jgi:yecA family protein
MKLLVKDDSLFYRNMLQGLLKSWGYEVVLAVDGHEEQRIPVGATAPRLAMLDCLMPGRSGFELCELIRARKQGYVYTILLRVAGQQSDVLNGIESGTDDYLGKPFEEFELRARLKAGELIVRSYEEGAGAHDAPKLEVSQDYLQQTWSRSAMIELAGKELIRAERSRAPFLTQALTDTELERLNDIFQGVNPGEAMSLEELDGFFCALICGPEVVPPSAYMPHIFGRDPVQGRWTSTVEEEQELMNLLTRHWNTITATLLRDEPHAVWMGKYGNDRMTGLDWARGFELGMSLGDDSWNRLINDDRFAVALAPIVALAEQCNPDSGLAPMTPEVQEEAVRALGASVLVIFRYFREVISAGNFAEC